MWPLPAAITCLPKAFLDADPILLGDFEVEIDISLGLWTDAFLFYEFIIDGTNMYLN